MMPRQLLRASGFVECGAMFGMRWEGLVGLRLAEPALPEPRMPALSSIAW